MKLLSVISKIQFNSALVGKTVLLKNFKKTVDVTLKKNALLKKKRYVRAKQAPFINKTITKEIVKRSHLRNKFLNTKIEIDIKTHNKQRNYCVTLIRNILWQY